jgi:AmmeMemoRadiSam system protein B
VIATRPPAVAGYFYPDDPQSLRREVRDCIEEQPARRPARAVIAPHAGYVYSGRVAGAVYGAVSLPNRFLLLGPNHTGRGVPLSLYPPDGLWLTPLGAVPVDAELTAALAAECPDLEIDTSAHRQEHSIEVQVPFLQVLAPECRLAAVCVGTDRLETLEQLGRAVARVVRAAREPILIVASSDMNHYESAEIAARKDRLAIERALAVDAPGLHRVVNEHDISMCGYAPSVAALTACRLLGASRGELVRYSHSGEVSGDHDRVVGYAGIAIP